MFKDFLRDSNKSYKLFDREFSAKTTPPNWGEGAVTILPLIRFC